MPFLAAQLAENASLKIAAVATAATTASLVATPEATATASSTATMSTMTALCGHVHGGFGSLVLHLHALLERDQQCIELSDANRLDSHHDRRDDGIEVGVEPSEDVGDKLLDLQFVAHRCHLIDEPLHLHVVFRHGRYALGHRGEHHACGNDMSVRL